MVIDIFFILMVTFGFYFGFTFGMMHVVLMVISLVFASLTAMRFTPTTANLISETFAVESPFMPFVAFVVTLIVVLMMARMIAKFLEETIDNKRFNMMSKIIGGFVVSLLFTLLYSVLVTFFGQAHVLKLVFNQDTFTTKENQEIYLIVADENNSFFDGNNKPYSMKMASTKDSIFHFEKAGKLALRTTGRAGAYKAFVVGQKQRFYIEKQDTFYFDSNQEVQVHVDHHLTCFCESKIIVVASNDTIHFECTDEYLSSKSKTSFFFKYIELIPKKGTIIMKEMLPFVKHFIDYMNIALERIEKGPKKKNRPIDVLKTDEKTTPTGEEQEADIFEEPQPTPKPKVVAPAVETKPEPIDEPATNDEYEG